jgi:hypothetical protein
MHSEHRVLGYWVTPRTLRFSAVSEELMIRPQSAELNSVFDTEQNAIH